MNAKAETDFSKLDEFSQGLGVFFERLEARRREMIETVDFRHKKGLKIYCPETIRSPLGFDRLSHNYQGKCLYLYVYNGDEPTLYLFEDICYEPADRDIIVGHMTAKVSIYDGSVRDDISSGSSKTFDTRLKLWVAYGRVWTILAGTEFELLDLNASEFNGYIENGKLEDTKDRDFVFHVLSNTKKCLALTLKQDERDGARSVKITDGLFGRVFFETVGIAEIDGLGRPLAQFKTIALHPSYDNPSHGTKSDEPISAVDRDEAPSGFAPADHTKLAS